MRAGWKKVLPARFLFTVYVVANKRAGKKKTIHLINEQAKFVRAGWKKNLKIISQHAGLFGTSK